MFSEKGLRAAANEMNDVMDGLDPVLDVKAKLSVLTEQVKEAIKFIDPDEDKFSKETQKVIDELTADADDADDDDAEEEPKSKAKGKKTPVEEADDDDDDDDAEEADDDDDDDATDNDESLKEKVEGAEGLDELKILAKENDEFVSLVKKLKTFVKVKLLRAAMIELLEEEKEEEQATANKLHKKNIGKKKATATVDDDDDDDDEEEEKPKAKKKGGIKKAGKEGGPGIIQTIVSLIEKAGKKGISKKEILEQLKEDFPDRVEQSMRNTINVQVPARINKEKFPVKKVGDDRYTKA